MASKSYEVLKCVKKDGVEYDEGATVSLDPTSAANLVEQGFLKEAEPGAKPVDTKPDTKLDKKDAAKKGDGL